MPPLQKSGKPAKKAAKSAGKPDPHKTGREMRRSYEHFGRVQILAGLVPQSADALQQLVHLADQAFHSGDYKSSAELLRAAEHFAFGTLSARDADTVARELKEELKRELEHMQHRAEDHGGAAGSSASVCAIYSQMSEASDAAFTGGSYCAAIEFARAAEALTHVGELAAKTLPTSRTTRRLAS